MKISVYTVLFIVHNVFADDVLVEVEQGWLLGTQEELVTEDGTYYSFKGIPYAEAPVNSLRFKDPRPPLRWDGVRNASEHGDICPQMDLFTGAYVPGNENCLFLNVYTPNITTDLLPVMLYIHGGGYKAGSGNVDAYGPDFFVRKHVILVTINYRLGALGFLCTDSKEVPGNAGLKDQLAAMKWVKKNIHKFGGDASNVTICGHSAGGSSVGYHFVSPASKGYFQKAILMSGTPYNDWTVPFEPVRRAFMLGQILGCESQNKTELLTCLQNVTQDKIVQANPTILTSEEINNQPTKLFLFTPVYEKYCGQDVFLCEDPVSLLNSGKVNEVDLMIGFTNYEGTVYLPMLETYLLDLYNRYPDMLVPEQMLIESNSKNILHVSSEIRKYYFGNQSISVKTMKETIDYISNSTITYKLHRFARALPNPGLNSRYLYKFSCYSKRNVDGIAATKYGIYGSGHLDILYYLFDPEALNLPIEKNTIEFDMVDLASTVFTNFAKHGNPTPKHSSLNVTWPQFDNRTLAYADINRTLTVANNPDASSWQFWSQIFADDPVKN